MNIDELSRAAAPLLSGPRLALLLFGALLVACMLPAWACRRRDARTFGGVNVWVKPLKFMAALALYAFTTAVLMLAAGDSGALDAIAALLIVTATFEVGYITLQASRAEASHYNSSDALHMALTAIMALGAVGLTASQLWLAIVIMDVRPDWQSSAALAGVVTGLVLTFVLATVSGFMLGGRRAPAGAGMAVTGWHRRGDLRPAHFLGVHAQQCIPALGLLAGAVSSRAPVALFAALTGVYLLAFAVAVRIEWRGGLSADMA